MAFFLIFYAKSDMIDNPYVIERDKDTEGHYSNDNLRQLTADELAKINAFKAKIDEMIKLYKSEK